MRAPLITVRTRGQEPCCSSGTHLQEVGLSGEEERWVKLCPQVLVPPVAPTPDQGALPQHLSCNSLCTERLREMFSEPSGCSAQQVNSPPSATPTWGSSRTPGAEGWEGLRAFPSWDQLSVAGGLLSASQTRHRNWPSGTGSDEWPLRVFRAGWEVHSRWVKGQ